MSLEQAARNVARHIPAGVLTCWGEGMVAIPVGPARALLIASRKGARVNCPRCGVFMSDGVEPRTYCGECEGARKQ